MAPTILHVDLNSYFATVEQQQNPKLRSKPVGIVKDIGRSCIIAASKEAKLLGIRTGSNAYEAKTICPGLILIKADFDKYLDYTKRFYRLVKSFVPTVNLFSLDEAFLDASDSLRLYGSAESLAQKIQAEIYLQMGEWVTASIGISYNRLLAKLAGEYAPKGGFCRIDKDNLDLALALVELTQICGIGHRLGAKLNGLGIGNLLQIRDFPDSWLVKRFGTFWGPELKRLAFGNDSHLLTLLDTNPHMQGVGRSITGFRLCDDEETIRQTIRNLIEETGFKIREMGLAGRRLSIFLQGEDKFWHRHLTLKYYLRHPEEIYDILYNRLYKNWKRNFAIIRFAVRIDLLRPLTELSLCILPKWEKRERLYRAVDAVNKKHGLFTLKPGVLLNTKIIRPEVTGFLGDKLYQFRD